MAETGDEPVQAVAGWARLIAEMNPIIFGSQPLHEAPHALLGCIDLPQVANLTAPFAISNCNGIARFGDIDSDENFRRLSHGSSSCGEDRLGPPEYPSDAQSRASHFLTAGGHMVLRCTYGLSSRRGHAPFARSYQASWYPAP